jgi:tRNA pseudouridine13 synthase
MEYRIKQVPEDFLVREIFTPRIGAGAYAYYLLRKREWTTQRAAERVARAAGKRPKFVNFSGNKDKEAVTEQFISILHGPRRDIEIEGGISARFLGTGSQRINLGSASGNEFTITVRDVSEGIPRTIRSFPNYFDEQRFGRNGDNHIAGRCIVKRDFQGACALIPETSEWLEKSPRDFVGALRSLPRRTLRLYAHSYQSMLWNEIASGMITRHPHAMAGFKFGKLAFPRGDLENVQVPLIGYGSEIPLEFRNPVSMILSRDGIGLEDFRVRQFPEFDLSGGYRSLIVEPSGLEITGPFDDELNPGKRKFIVKFTLENGSYATMAIRAIFS